MPGDFPTVLLSSSPPAFASNRLNFNMVTDVTKSYFVRIAAQCAADVSHADTQLLSSSTSSSSSSTTSSNGNSYASLAELGNLHLQSALHGRCFSDTDVQRSWRFASAVIQRCAVNRSEPSLAYFTANADGKSRFACDDNEDPADEEDEEEEEEEDDVLQRPADEAPVANCSDSQQYDRVASTSDDNTQTDVAPCANSDDTQSVSNQCDKLNGNDYCSTQCDSQLLATTVLLNRIDTYTCTINARNTPQASGCNSNGVNCTALTPPSTPTEPATARSLNRKGQYVRFADEMGQALNSVRVIENVLDLSDAALDDDDELDWRSSRPDAAAARYNPLVLEFAQPVADYCRFREKLDRQNVCLENVLALGYRVSGTVRVRNLAFEKRVFVRVSTDHWQSHTDHYAKFVSSSGNADSLYDSFAFDLGDLSNKLTLHPVAGCSWSNSQQRVELAVGFVCGSQSFWDSNSGRNYTLLYVPPDAASCNSRSHKPYTASYRPDFSAFQQNFGEFTAWNHYDSYNPYY